MADRSLRFDLIAKDKSFSKTLDQAGRKGQRLNRELGRTLGGAGDTAGRRFSVGLNKRLGGGFTAAARMATRTAGLIGGAFAAVQIGQFLKSAIDEGREAAKVGKQTAAVIKSTGSAAKLTANDIGDLAESISNATGVDDELIQSGENWLLTFKRVRDEAGRGNDVFTRATKAAVDMAAAMHQGEVSASGLHSANTMLGKALNDPIKGMQALAKAGVTFDKSQQEQIKTLVEHGDLLGAQKIILAEVESQTKGFAEASTDTWQKLGVQWDNIKEQLGTALLPVLQRIGDWLSVTLPTAVDKAKGVLKTLKKWWDDNKESVQTLADLLVDTFVPNVGESDKQVRTFAESLKALSGFLTDVTIFVFEVVKAWLALEHVTIGVISIFGSMLIAAGHVINVLDRLSGGTGHAGDQFVTFGQKVKDQATKELKEVREAAKRAQEAIDNLKGKDVRITGTTSLHFTESFTASDWTAARLAAGRMAEGGKITKGTGPTADDVLIRASKGEAVVPARSASKPGFKAWAAAEGIPGFALGGKIGQTGTAYSGVGKMMDRLGTLRLAALVRQLVGGGGSAKIKAYIRSLDSHPYVWGGAGPGGFDCSGITGAVALAMRGKPYGHGQRVWTTSSIRPGILGLKSGLGGVHQIGVTAGTGHMAGRYGGLGYEAESTRTGIKIGAAASRPESFARRFHMARGGKVNADLVNAFARIGADIGGDPGRLRINGKVFDQGGLLPPGLTMAYNGTGRPETVGIDYDKLAAAIVRAQRATPPVVYLDRQKVSRAVADGQLWEARR